MRAALLTFAAIHLVQGLSIAIDPQGFYEAVGNFGTYSEHAMRDNAAFPLAAAIALWLAASRPSWHAPVLALVALQNGFHAVNHLVDVGNAEPAWVGPFDFISLAAVAILAGRVYRVAHRKEVHP